MIYEDYKSDIQVILEHQHDNGGNYWATADGRLAVGHPYSTIGAVLILSELGLYSSSNPLKGAVDLLLKAWRDDGRFNLAPRGTLYPCYTATTARALCRLGYANDARMYRTFEHLLEIQHDDGGWRCNKFPYGKGTETAFSNPGPTLEALDAFRFTEMLNNDERLDRAVEFLLNHWETRKPLGPCHFGIGERFMRIEYPMFRYNILLYVYVLSFYNRAKSDHRYLSALEILQSKLMDGKVVVQHPNRKLEHLSFCRKGAVSEIATDRYNEILANLKPQTRSEKRKE